MEALQRINAPVNRQSLIRAVVSLKNFDSGVLPPVRFGPDWHMGLTAMQRFQVSGSKWTADGTLLGE